MNCILFVEFSICLAEYYVVVICVWKSNFIDAYVNINMIVMFNVGYVRNGDFFSFVFL